MVVSFDVLRVEDGGGSAMLGFWVCFSVLFFVLGAVYSPLLNSLQLWSELEFDCWGVGILVCVVVFFVGFGCVGLLWFA